MGFEGFKSLRSLRGEAGSLYYSDIPNTNNGEMPIRGMPIKSKGNHNS